MIKNDQIEELNFGINMRCYLSLEQVYLEVACEVIYLSKKDNELSMKFFMML